MRFSEGDRVRIHIPDSSDIDHRHHGKVGTITSAFTDDLGGLTGSPLDSESYTVEFDDGGTFPARRRDLRPVDD